MTELPHRGGRILALLWALIVVGCAAHLGQAWYHGSLQIDTDVLALLPHDDRNAAAEAALARLSEGASRRVVIVLACKDRDPLRAAASAIRTALDAPDSPLQAIAGANSSLTELIDQYAPYRDRLLDRHQRQRLSQQTPAQIARAALQQLYRPGISLRALGPLDDPTGSFAAWLAERAGASKVRPDGPWLTLTVANGGDAATTTAPASDLQLIILPYELRSAALSVAALEQLQPLLDRARTLAAAHGVELLSAGVPVHAAAASQQAVREMSIIGLGAAAGIALLMLLCFRSPRPMLLVLGTVSIGLIVAMSACVLVFERVHLITLVFGASLVGVAEDYAIHYLSTRALASPREHGDLLRPMLPGLLLAFVTSALGYLALALAPFPGLKQMALYSIVGLAAALVTVLLWFPTLVGPRLAATRLCWKVAISRRYVPQLRATPWSLAAFAAALIVAAVGWARLTTSDDLRALQSSPQSLIEQQTRIGRWLAEPSPAQFYLVRGDSEEALLKNEEALVERLSALADEGFISGHRALSDWVPSRARQQVDAARLEPAFRAAAAALRSELGDSTATPRPLADHALTVQQWLASPVSAPLRPLWLGQLDGAYASVVQVAGINTPAQLPRLAALATELPGVLWVDKIADYSRLLREYRRAMTWVLGASFVLIFLVLLPRFGWQSWRVLAPTLLALAVVLAWLGWRGESLQLFHVLGLTVMLGMSVDYGIFLMEPVPGDAPWLAVVLGAVNTLLAFGLLAFSQTPALAAFGITLLIGISVAWLIAPMLCHPQAPRSP